MHKCKASLTNNNRGSLLEIWPTRLTKLRTSLSNGIPTHVSKTIVSRLCSKSTLSSNLCSNNRLTFNGTQLPFNNTPSSNSNHSSKVASTNSTSSLTSTRDSLILSRVRELKAKWIKKHSSWHKAPQISSISITPSSRIMIRMKMTVMRTTMKTWSTKPLHRWIKMVIFALISKRRPKVTKTGRRPGMRMKLYRSVVWQKLMRFSNWKLKARNISTWKNTWSSELNLSNKRQTAKWVRMATTTWICEFQAFE